MRKRLAAWDTHFATDEEKAIAARINKEVGYEGTPFNGDVLQDAGNVDLGLRSAKKQLNLNTYGIGVEKSTPFLYKSYK